MTGQKRVVTELKFLWQVNTTGDSPKFILSPEHDKIQNKTNKRKNDNNNNNESSNDNDVNTTQENEK